MDGLFSRPTPADTPKASHHNESVGSSRRSINTRASTQVIQDRLKEFTERAIGADVLGARHHQAKTWQVPARDAFHLDDDGAHARRRREDSGGARDGLKKIDGEETPNRRNQFA